MFNYENHLISKLNGIIYDNNLNIKIMVVEEQAFYKKGSYAPNMVIVIVKYLTSSITYEGNTQPIQLNVICEQNDMEQAMLMMNIFATNNNFAVVVDGDTYVKQEYRSPVVLSNFNDIGTGYRSLLYIAGTLFIMENVIDVQNITFNGVSINPLGFNVSYQMSPNTQQLPNDYISSSVKSTSSFSIQTTIPILNKYTKETNVTLPFSSSGSVTLPKYETYKDLTIINGTITNETAHSFTYTLNSGSVSGSISYKKVFNFNKYILCIMNKELTGNEDITISWNMDDITFNYNFKLISAQIVTAPNSVPSFSLGFMR